MNKLNVELFADKYKINISDNNNYINIVCVSARQDCDIYSDSKEIYFENIWNKVDLQYKINKKSIKETLFISDILSDHKFKFLIDTNLKIEYKNGVLSIKNSNGLTVFSFNEPFIITKSGKIINDKTMISFDRSSNIYTLTVEKLDADKYPIVVDPTIILEDYNG